LGTPTTVAVSGTVEEVERTHKQGKLVKVFVYSGPVDRRFFKDPDYVRLREFEDGLKKRALLGTYRDEDFLQQIENAIHNVANSFMAEQRAGVLGTVETEPKLISPIADLTTIMATHQRQWTIERLSDPSGIGEGNSIRDSVTRRLWPPSSTSWQSFVTG
jgi:hypothetical protein